MTAAQKTARANFKKAIEYRKKTGCTLKQAFAKFKKPSAKKAAKKDVKKVVRKKAVKKVVRKVSVKKVARKKVSGIKTNIKKQTVYNMPSVKDQIGAIKKGNTFIHYKGCLIEKMPLTVGKNKKKYYFVCDYYAIVADSLAKAKARINYHLK